MTRASRRHTHAQTKRQPESQHAAASSRPTSGRWRRLVVLLALGAILVGVAGWIRLRVGSHPVLRIPPVETADLLPAVAKEIHEKQEAIVAASRTRQRVGRVRTGSSRTRFSQGSGGLFRGSRDTRTGELPVAVLPGNDDGGLGRRIVVARV